MKTVRNSDFPSKKLSGDKKGTAKRVVFASSEKERKELAEDILLAMTAHMKEPLGE